VAENTWAYIHSLLFRCEQSTKPVSTSVASQEANVDGQSIYVQCECRWLKALHRINAKSHSVAPRESAKTDSEHCFE
jgi:hypothetical protein